MPQPKWKCGAKKKKFHEAVIFAVFLYKGIKDCNYNPEREAKNCHDVGQLNHQKNDSDGQKKYSGINSVPWILRTLCTDCTLNLDK